MPEARSPASLLSPDRMWLGAAGVVLAASAMFSFHFRWVLTHFSHDGYLLDSGWLAHLFASRDPLLTNPSAISDLSFYAHHLSPHIFVFGAPLTFTDLTGFEIFAMHQGFFFALFLIALLSMPWWKAATNRDRMVAATSAVLIGGLSNALFQTAAYPHYEVAMFSIAAVALAAWLSGREMLFLLSILWLPLIREDGGFYASFVCMMAMVLSGGHVRPRRLTIPTLLALAVGGVLVSLLAMAIKSAFFPGFGAFTTNFGQSLSHLSAGLFASRLMAMLTNPNILPVIAGAAGLAIFDVRYAAGLVLLSPLFLLHLLAVRPELGTFTLYYVMPWLLAWVASLTVYVDRTMRGTTARLEAALVLVASAALTTPIQAAMGARESSWWVVQSALTRPVVDVDAMKEFALWIRRDYPTGATSIMGSRFCASVGIAALIPAALQPDEVLNPEELASCHAVMILRGDIHSRLIGENLPESGFALVARRERAELWIRNPE